MLLDLLGLFFEKSQQNLILLKTLSIFAVGNCVKMLKTDRYVPYLFIFILRQFNYLMYDFF